jgi:hypothetical protein
LAHAQECTGRDDEGEECKRGEDSENPEGWHDEDSARQHIEEAPLSVEVRCEWHAPGSESEDTEYNILLCTGGPAARIVGGLERGQPTTARFEYQDWFKPWTEAQTTSEQNSTMLEWAQVFYFGD